MVSLYLIFYAKKLSRKIFIHFCNTTNFKFANITEYLSTMCGCLGAVFQSKAISISNNIGHIRGIRQRISNN